VVEGYRLGDGGGYYYVCRYEWKGECLYGAPIEYDRQRK